MRVWNRNLATLLVMLALAMGQARAGTTAGTVAASVTLANDCVLTTSNFSFGTSSALQPSSVAATTTLLVQCSSGTPYTVAIGPSPLMGAPTPYNHALVSTTTTLAGHPLYLPYNLTQDAAGTTNWGYTVGTDTVGGVGTGSAQTLTVYGHLTALSGDYVSGHKEPPEPDTYTDTLTITLQY